MKVSTGFFFIKKNMKENQDNEENGNSIYPKDITIKDARDAIKDCQEFKEYIDHDRGLAFFNYRWCNLGTFPPISDGKTDREKYLLAVRRECRGLVFDVKTGQVCARRFHKFFNVGERNECKEEFIDLNRPHILLAKHDGSLVSPIMIPGTTDIEFASKSGITHITDMVVGRFLPKNQHYIEFGRKILQSGWTPLFEWCSLRNKIVLEYANDSLILLAIRNNKTGNYMKHTKVRELAQKHKIEITECVVDDVEYNHKSVSELEKYIKSQPQIEGFVLVFEDNGEMHKIKTDWYFSKSNRKQKMENSFNSERGVWKIILDQKIDDMVSIIDPILFAQISKFSEILFAAIVEFHDNIYKFVSANTKLSKKDFVFLVNRESNDIVKPLHLCIKIYDVLSNSKNTQDTMEIVMTYVKNCCGSKTKHFDFLKKQLGGMEFGNL